MPFRLGVPELLIILVIIFVIFGAGKLPQIVGSVGKSIRSFREGKAGELDDDEEVVVVSKKKKSAKKAA